jgi:DNA-binding NtrC family response regulator
MRALFARLERGAGAPETVVLVGEPGTGKEILARGMHAVGPRQDGPFVVLRCGGVMSALIERELFGGGAGPGLFEQARGGTLLIDDLGALPLDLQPRLLSALDARTGGAPTPRVIGGTRRSLRGRVADGTIREDLVRRLAIHEVRVPALRDRKDDIPALVEHFLGLRSPPRKIGDLPPHTMEMLVAHDWPANVRELRSTVARIAVFSELPGARGPAPAPRPPAPLDD